DACAAVSSLYAAAGWRRSLLANCGQENASDSHIAARRVRYPCGSLATVGENATPSRDANARDPCRCTLIRRTALCPPWKAWPGIGAPANAWRWPRTALDARVR